MTLSAVDWAIVIALVAILSWAALYTQRYAGNVSGFLAANRCAGRYLISVAFNMSQLGVITLVWYFQQNYDVGYTSIWWGLLEGPTMIFIALSGWVIYRFRRTRALTLAQFFEMRYSKRFRIFAGLVAFLSGIINYGIFPGVAARYFMAFCGFPKYFELAGFQVSTFAAIMVVLMGTALTFVFLGGQIAIMVTDFLQGVFSNVGFTVIIVFLLLTIPWQNVADTLLGRVWEGAWVAQSGIHPPAGHSLINPFKLGNEARFNIWYWIISVVVIIYGMRAWQGDQGYNAAARTPHEARMANILNGWRFRVLMLIVVVLPIYIRTLMHHPAYAAQAWQVKAHLQGVHPEALVSELRIPYGTAALLPAGLLGVMCAAMLGAFISTNDTYLHSWGAIFVQDVILPFRKKPLSQKAHLRLLKAAIFGVALFAIFFSSFYEPNQYISMFLALTGAVFVGGAGSAIIGGLYWKRGTTAAAWTAMIVGMSLSGYGIIVKRDFMAQIFRAGLDSWWAPFARLSLWIHDDKFVTGQVMTFVAIAAAVLSYVTISLVQRREYNLDKLLHRGKYAVAEDQTEEHEQPTILEKLGFTREFTGTDKWVTWITISWPLVWTVIFVVVTLWCLASPFSDQAWLRYWHGWTWFILFCGAAILVWFTIGGFRDLFRMFRRLKTYQADETDDGRVESFDQD